MKKIIFFLFLFFFSILSLSKTSDLKFDQIIKTNIKNNNSINNLEVSFSQVLINDKSTENISLEDNNKTVTFSINQIDNNKKITYQINNNSKKDLIINVKCSNTEIYKDYYKFNNKYEKNINSNTHINGMITFKLLNSNIPVKDVLH